MILDLSHELDESNNGDDDDLEKSKGKQIEVNTNVETESLSSLNEDKLKKDSSVKETILSVADLDTKKNSVESQFVNSAYID